MHSIQNVLKQNECERKESTIANLEGVNQKEKQQENDIKTIEIRDSIIK